MFDINSTGKIQLTRGDTFKSPLFINQGNQLYPMRYQLSENDTLYLALLEPNQPFEFAILKQVYTWLDEKTQFGDTYIKFRAEDTEKLLPGKYYYTIKLRRVLEDGNEEVHTVIPETEFYILR